MPSEHTSGTTTSDRPTFPRLEAEIGEDPARFLATDMSPWPILRGIDSRERATAWLAVARQLDADDRVLDALETTVERCREGEA